MEPNGVFRGLTRVGLFTIYFTLKQEVFNFEKRYKSLPSLSIKFTVDWKIYWLNYPKQNILQLLCTTFMLPFLN